MTTYAGINWDIDPQFELFRTWSTGNKIGQMLSEYLGIIAVDNNTYIYYTMDPDIGLYWELDVYSYPSFELYKSYPLVTNLIFSSKNIDGTQLLSQGNYFFALRIGDRKKDIPDKFKVTIR